MARDLGRQFLRQRRPDRRKETLQFSLPLSREVSRCFCSGIPRPASARL